MSKFPFSNDFSWYMFVSQMFRIIFLSEVWYIPLVDVASSLASIHLNTPH